MITLTKTLAGCVAVWALGLVAAGLCADSADFSPYEVILTRQPFGATTVAPLAQPPSPLVAPPNSFVKDLRMCAITEDATGIRVGLVDVKSNKSYYLTVGDSEDGLTLVDADFNGEKALLRKDAEEYWIAMSNALANAQSPVGLPALGTEAAGARIPLPSFGQPVRRPGRLSMILAAPVDSLAAGDRELRRRSESMLTNRQPAPAALTAAELDQARKQYQMDLVRSRRSALSPAPIELTPEMDAQLVAEGVLAAQ
jgi:hypothetical protein